MIRAGIDADIAVALPQKLLKDAMESGLGILRLRIRSRSQLHQSSVVSRDRADFTAVNVFASRDTLFLDI